MLLTFFLNQPLFAEEGIQSESIYNHLNDSHIYIGLASPYIKNPASLFGHNFILVSNDHDNLLNGFTFSYEANNTSKSNLEYLTKGIFGGFDGHYYIRPVYDTINIYNNFEDRTLYLYPLKLSKTERNNLIKKMLTYAKTKNHPYYFFDKNCAFYLYKFISNKVNNKRYFTPQDTITRLSHLINLSETKVIPSLKAEIKNISNQETEIVSVYRDAKFELYKHMRGKKNNYNKALIRLNKLSLKSKEKVVTYRQSTNELSLKKYSKLMLGINQDSKLMGSLSLVDTKYFETNAVSKLSALHFNYNNFDKDEFNFKLLSVDSKSSFEKYFCDLSWKAEARYLDSRKINTSSRDALLGVGVALPIIKNFLISFRGIGQYSYINSQNKFKGYPELEVEFNHEKINAIGAYSKEYLKDTITTIVEYNINRNFSTSLNFKKIKGYREDISTNLVFTF